MYWILMITLALFLFLLCLAGKEEVTPDTSPLLKPFHKTARYLYKKAVLYFPKLISSPQVEKDLSQLHPGETKEWLKTQYYVKKMSICLVIVLVGSFFGAAAKFSAQENVILQENGIIVRGGYKEEARKIWITTRYGLQQMDFQVEVSPIRLAEEDAQRLFQEFVKMLPEYILGENDNLQSVNKDLKMGEKYGDSPISVRWESSRPGIISSTGQVHSVEAAEQVMLQAYLNYGDYSRMEELAVTVIPPVFTEEQLLYRQMEELLQQSQEDSLEQEEWRLPAEWQGESITWEQIVEDDSVLVWTAAVITAIAVFLFLDKDMHDQLEKRRKSLRREYPEIVHKLVLFVGAGMTIRGAFQKIAGDYEADSRKSDRRSPAYEEMIYACRELRSGVSEGMSYEHFGRRTGLQEYIRLTTLLAQNLKKGNSALLERLREEADKAAEERVRQSRKLGEEAGTKLLVPMVLMLGVVMAIIMIPAFSNM